MENYCKSENGLEKILKYTTEGFKDLGKAIGVTAALFGGTALAGIGTYIAGPTTWRFIFEKIESCDKESHDGGSKFGLAVGTFFNAITSVPMIVNSDNMEYGLYFIIPIVTTYLDYLSERIYQKFKFNNER